MLKKADLRDCNVVYHSFYEFEGREFHKVHSPKIEMRPELIQKDDEFELMKYAKEPKTRLIRDDDGLCRRFDVITGEELNARPYVHALARSSISRARTAVRRILVNNLWQYFGTITFATEKRTDDDWCLSRFALWRRWLKRHYPSAFYICFPERHRIDGVLHFHLMIGGVSLNFKNPEHFKFLYYDKKNHCGVYQIVAFKYGRTNVQKINSLKRASTYCQKYVGKDCGQTSLPLGAKRYYASYKINRVKIIKRVRPLPIGQDLRLYVISQFYDHVPELKYYNSYSNTLYFEIDRRGLPLLELTS